MAGQGGAWFGVVWILVFLVGRARLRCGKARRGTVW
jgi:hypothetical protein